MISINTISNIKILRYQMIYLITLVLAIQVLRFDFAEYCILIKSFLCIINHTYRPTMIETRVVKIENHTHLKKY